MRPVDWVISNFLFAGTSDRDRTLAMVDPVRQDPRLAGLQGRTARCGATAPRAKTLRRRVRRFPCTIALSVEYAALVLWPALYDGDQHRAFVYEVTLLGLGVTFAVESCLRFLPSRWGRSRPINLCRAGGIALVGAGSILLSTRLGVGVYGYGVSAGLQHASSLGSLLTPLQWWEPTGLALVIYGQEGRPDQRRAAFAIIGVVLAMQLATVLITSSTFQLFQLLFVVGMLGIFSGLVRFRWILVALLVVILAWPALYALRNAGRVAKGASVTAFSNSTATSRIEDDQYLAEAQVAKETGELPVGVLGYAWVIDIGVLPRALQPGRPVLQTGALISVATGGPNTSSMTLTTFGEVWLLHSGLGLAITCAVIAAVGGLLIRDRHPYAFVILAAVIWQLLWIESSFPDAIAGFLQFSLSGGVAMLLFRPTRTASTR